MPPEPTLTERFELRFTKAMLDGIDEWRARKKPLPTRAEAIRRLIDMGLRADEGESEPND